MKSNFLSRFVVASEVSLVSKNTIFCFGVPLYFRGAKARCRHLGGLNNLQIFAISPTGQPMCIYGDPAYPLRVHLQAPFRQGRLTPQMQAYNDVMSELRLSVE